MPNATTAPPITTAAGWPAKCAWTAPRLGCSKVPCTTKAAAYSAEAAPVAAGRAHDGDVGAVRAALAIVEATCALIEAHWSMPSPGAVADRAGVARRSVSPYRRVARLLEHESTILAARQAALWELNGAEVESAFGSELARHGATRQRTVLALQAAASWFSWDARRGYGPADGDDWRSSTAHHAAGRPDKQYS